MPVFGFNRQKIDEHDVTKLGISKKIDGLEEKSPGCRQ